MSRSFEFVLAFRHVMCRLLQQTQREAVLQGRQWRASRWVRRLASTLIAQRGSVEVGLPTRLECRAAHCGQHRRRGDLTGRNVGSFRP